MRSLLPERLRPFADFVLAEAKIPELPRFYSGKVRENYDLDDGTRVLIATDRVSAFDQHLALIPFKGQVLTAIARFWFEATRDICGNYVQAYPDPNVVIGTSLRMMPVEIVVRDYLAGTTSTSILPMYQMGAREMYGLRFPDGLLAHEKLPETILTPTSKAAHGSHDAPLSVSDILSQKLLTESEWAEVSAKALALFARGRAIAASRGLILADTKYEFGFDPQGVIILADEIHTPDSSRYWVAESYFERFEAGARPESFDKDFVRNWIKNQCDPYNDPIPAIPTDVILEAAATYIKSFETLTGLDFQLPKNPEPIFERIRKNLAFLWQI